jgi:hypothetical protein
LAVPGGTKPELLAYLKAAAAADTHPSPIEGLIEKLSPAAAL